MHLELKKYLLNEWSNGTIHLKKYALDFHTTRVNENLKYKKGLRLIYVSLLQRINCLIKSVFFEQKPQ